MYSFSGEEVNDIRSAYYVVTQSKQDIDQLIEMEEVDYDSEQSARRNSNSPTMWLWDNRRGYHIGSQPQAIFEIGRNF